MCAPHGRWDLSDTKIMFKHLMPNGIVSTITFMPFIVAGSVTT